MPIYCNHDTLLMIPSIKGYESYIRDAGLKQMKEEANKEDVSKEEYYLYNIISACELILDDLENGANIEQADFNNLGYVDGIMLRMQKNVNQKLKPTNINNEKRKSN